MNLDLIHYLKCFSCTAIETLIILTIAFALIKQKPTHIISTILKMLCFIIITAAFTYIDTDDFIFRLLPLVTLIIFISSLTGKKIIHSIYITLIVYICILIIEFTIIAFLQFTATMQDSFYIQLLANGMTFIIALILTRLIPIHIVYDFALRKDTALRFFLGNTFAAFFFINYLIIAHLSHFIYYLIIILAFLALMVFVNIELLRSRVIVDKQRSIIDSYNKYLPIVDELIEQVRSRQHGYDNNIQSLSALSLTCTDYESLKTELLKNIDYMSNSDLPVFLLKFNLKLLSGLFFQKYSVSQKKGINMAFTIKNYNIQSKAPEYIIVEAVGILMDNAIEASTPNDTIHITVDCINDKFHFDIMNVGPTYTSELHHKLFKRGYSTKAKSERERGLGLPQLLELSNKYNGRLEVGNRERDEQQYLFFTIDL